MPKEELKLTHKPHDMQSAEATNIIYDTLFRNDKFTTMLDIDPFVGVQECDSAQGFIYFDIDTEKGTRRVHIQVSIEDMQDETE